jgi:hypothetical protein
VEADVETGGVKGGAAPEGLIDRIRGAGPGTLLFAAALALSCALMLDWLSQLTFWRDEWAFILDRRGSGIDVYFDPFVEQLLAVPVAIYKLLIAGFGIESPLPFQLVHLAVFLATMAVLFVYLRRRVGEWLALAAVLPILVLGPSWDDLLFPFQVSLIGALGCGVGALLALDREDRRGDVAAAVLLLIGLFCQHVAIPFVVAATIDIAFTRERYRRAFVIVVPTAIWLLWYLGWGREAQNFVSFHNFSTEIGYVADGLASSLSSLLGLAVPRDEMTLSPVDWGRPLLLIALGFAVWRVAKVGIGAMPRRFWAVVAAQLAFWSLTGLNAAFFGQATSGRYQLVGAVLWVMIAAELLRGVTIRRPAMIIVLSVAVLAALANFSLLRKTADGLAGIAEQERGGLAALELTRGEVADDFVLTEDNSGVDYLGIVDAASYFSAIDAYGSPAYTPAELATAPELARAAADKVFAAALELQPLPADLDAIGPCSVIVIGAEPAVVPIPPTGAALLGGVGKQRIGLRRYATQTFPVNVGTLRPTDAVALAIPEDGAAQPWQLGLTGRGRAKVCDLGG